MKLAKKYQLPDESHKPYSRKPIAVHRRNNNDRDQFELRLINIGVPVLKNK